ncbi:MAG: hybrid sensor histidine kinase/response regulator [Candidatus Latescibacteria bacterium]|jgi:CheY-like chemotaxis protein|nr:hybrid sensor histidine kinase/response regulator [Candidatus Latescibacterota bacterium]
MLKEEIADPEQLELIEVIFESSLRAKDLVHRLHLSTRGVEDKSIESVAINEIIQEAINVTRPRWQDESASKKIMINVSTNLNAVHPIRGTETRLLDIFVNFIFNAIDAMPNGGEISIETQQRENLVEVTFCDTGIGMDEETQKRIFEPFFTTKVNIGTGLGLSTVYRTITTWGGTVDVITAPNAGTTFKILLPTDQELGKAAVENVKPENDQELRRKRILIVDDDVTIRNVLHRFLRDRHIVDTAENGQSCLEKAKNANYEIVFIDLGLPDLRGDLVAEQLKEMAPETVTVLITGWELSDIDFNESAFDFSLAKPFTDMRAIDSLLAQAFNKHNHINL